ncbi:MAG: amidohydrolase [Cytophagales bacterium]|nr:amidohydrolase [Armatimonadota bacterium]
MVIDCDFHHAWRSTAELLEYMPEPYRTEIGRFGLRTLLSGIRYEEGGMRWDATPPNGGAAGSDPEYARTHHLDRYDIRFALLSGQTGPTAGIPDPDYTAAVCRAINDWTLARWIPVDPRYKMGLHVPLQDPHLAAAEIDRLGEHPDVVAVCLSGTAGRIPPGHRYFWPLFEAAQRHDLALHFHPSTTSVIANYASTAAGMASTYLESHTSLPQFYQAYLISLIFEGVFEKFPRLRVMFIEGGVSWLAHVLWRMDKEFKALRQQAPYLSRLPSAYVFDHVRLGTQPIEEPPHPAHLLQIFEMIQAEKTLVWASDYPHFDFDEPTVLPRGLSEQARRRILHDNACEWLGLPPLAVPQAEMAAV